MKYEFIVTVETEDIVDALQVMNERIDFEEDYGFEYTVEWEVKND
jgi:hypothetical protein